MATQTIQFPFLTAVTPVVKLFADDGLDVLLATPTATEATNRLGVYSFTQTDRAAGNYLITATGGGVNAVYRVCLTLTTAVFSAAEWSAARNIAEIQSGLTAPTAAANATAVRSELATELARLDVAVGTRLATAGYTVPPSIAALATSSALALVQADTAAIKTQTDQLGFTGTYVRAIVRDITPTALAKFATDDTGETVAANGSVSKLSQGGSGGVVTQDDIDSIVSGVGAGLSSPTFVAGWPRRCFERLGDEGTRGHSHSMRIIPDKTSQPPIRDRVTACGRSDSGSRERPQFT